MYRTIKGIFVLTLLLFSVTFSQDPANIPNAYISSMDVYHRNIDKYMGIKYLFYNILQYDGEKYEPPYPYHDGRVRNGKYKASQTAMNNYLQELYNYNGKKFTLVGLANEDEDMPGIIMACENGDTLLFNANIVNGQFVNEDYLKEEQKNIGAKVYYINHKSNRNLVLKKIEEDHAQPMKSIYAHFYGFTEVGSENILYYLPYLSEWKITGVSYDTTFIGKKKVKSNNVSGNIFNRIKYTMENHNYGIYEYFPFNINDLNAAAMEKDSIAKVIRCSKMGEELLFTGSRSDGNAYGYEAGQEYFFRQLATTCIKSIPAAHGRHYVFAKSIDSAKSYNANSVNELFANKTDFPEEDKKNIIDWASKGYVEAMYAKTIGIDNEECHYEKCSSAIIACAKKGFPIALNYIASVTRYTQDDSAPFITTDEKIVMMKVAWQHYGQSEILNGIFSKIMENPQTKRDLIGIYKEADKYGYKDAKDQIQRIENRKITEKLEKEITTDELKKNGLEKLMFKIQNASHSGWTNDKYMYYKLLELQKESIANKYNLKIDPSDALNIAEKITRSDFQDIENVYKEILYTYKIAKKYNCPKDCYYREIRRLRNNLESAKHWFVKRKQSLMRQDDDDAKTEMDLIIKQTENLEYFDQELKKLQ